MALNILLLKKYCALLFCAFLPTMGLVLGERLQNFWWGLLYFFFGTLISVLLANLFLKNPFTDMLEGKGLLALDITSTGIIRPFIVKVAHPFIYGKIGKESVKDVFDREEVYNMTTPVKAEKEIIKAQDGSLKLEISEEDYNRSRFGLFHYPVLIYNAQIKSLLTKDWLSDNEKTSFAEHTILYLNRMIEDLSSIVRDFARYVVEMTKPKTSIFGNWLFWVIIIGAIIVLGALFAPAIMEQFGSFTAQTKSTISTATSGSIMPK